MHGPRAGRWAAEDLSEDVALSVSRHLVQVVQDRVIPIVGRRVFGMQTVDDTAVFPGYPGGHGLVNFVGVDVRDSHVGSPFKRMLKSGRFQGRRARRSASLRQTDEIRRSGFSTRDLAIISGAVAGRFTEK